MWWVKKVHCHNCENQKQNTRECSHIYNEKKTIKSKERALTTKKAEKVEEEDDDASSHEGCSLDKDTFSDYEQAVARNQADSNKNNLK